MITNNEQEIEDIQKKTELASNRLKEVQEEVLTKTKEASEIETELGEARKAREHAFAQKADMEKQAFEAEQKRDQLKDEVSSLQTKLEKHADEHEAHRVYHSSMDSNLAEKQAAFVAKEQELNERIAEHAKKEAGLEENRAKVESARAKFAEAAASVTW